MIEAAATMERLEKMINEGEQFLALIDDPSTADAEWVRLLMEENLHEKRQLLTALQLFTRD